MSSYVPGTPCWVDLGTTDVKAAIEFYGGLFGWQFVSMGPNTNDYHQVVVDGQPVAGLGEAERSDIPPYWTTYVSVDDAELTAKTAEQAGGTIVVPATPVMDAGSMAVVSDPTGAMISLWQPAQHIGARIVNEPGTFSWSELATRSTAAATAFYEKVFGWTCVDVSTPQMAYMEWHLRERPIGGMLPIDHNFPADMPSFWSTYFAVSDCDDAARRVADLGGRVFREPWDIGPGRMSVVADPQGAMFNVIALTDPATS